MRKLKLENLAVESFETGARTASSGTVQAFSMETGDHNCGPHHSDYSPEQSCADSCAPTYCSPTGGPGGMTGPFCP